MRTLIEEARYDQVQILPEEEFKDRWGIKKLFMDVPEFCRITGFPKSTIYQYIREGRFFIPFILVNKTPFIKTEDFLTWYRGSATDYFDKLGGIRGK